MSDSLEELFSMIDGFAAKHAPDQDQVPPTFFMINPDGSTNIAVAPWANEQEKDAILDHLRQEMATRGTLQYGAIVEVWIATVSPDEAVNRREPRLREDRKEALTIFVADRSGAKICGFREIIRTDVAVSLGEIARGEADGRMMSLLEDA